MEGSQKRNNSMVFVLVGSALFLAVATFIAMLLLTSRSSSTNLVGMEQDQAVPAGNSLFINGIPVFINADPAKTIILVSELNLAQGGQVVNPTETPIPPTAGPTATPVPTAAPTRDPNPVIFKEYVVVAGDTLYSIAEAQNSSIELMAKHGIDDDDLIPGSPLPKPLPYANPAYCPGATPYVVRDKDTVYRIAVQFNKTVDAIAQYNGLDAEYKIDVTQVICIPL